jgi:hypothetical protein
VPLKRTPHFIITKSSWFMLFEEIIAVYSENRIKPTDTKYSVKEIGKVAGICNYH